MHLQALLLLTVLAGEADEGPRSALRCPAGTTLDATAGVSGCYDASGTTHGPFEVRDDRGNLLESSTFVHGKLDGRSTRFHPNGKKAHESEWKAGIPAGAHRDWFVDGKKAAERHYSLGVPDGEWTLFHPNGKLAWRRVFKRGKRVSEETFDDAGQPFKEPGIAKAVLAAVIRAHRDEVRACYEKKLAEKRFLSGKVSVSLRIGPDGKVTRAEAAGSSIAADVTSCVVERMGKIEFPRPNGGGTLDVTYPWSFTPGRAR